MTVIPDPLYSPDLAPCEFFLFPRMKGTKINLNYIQRRVSNRAMYTPVSAIKSNESIFYTEITTIFPENHKNTLILSMGRM